MMVGTTYDVALSEELGSSPYASSASIFSLLPRARENSPCSVWSDDSEVTVTPGNWRSFRPHSVSALHSTLDAPRMLRQADRNHRPSMSAGLCHAGAVALQSQAAQVELDQALQYDWPSVDLNSQATRVFRDQFAAFDRDVRAGQIRASTWRSLDQVRAQLDRWSEEVRFEAYQQNWPWFTQAMQSSLEAYVPALTATVLTEMALGKIAERMDLERRGGWRNPDYESELYNEVTDELADMINQTPERHQQFDMFVLGPSFALDQLYDLGNGIGHFSRTEALLFSYQVHLDHGDYETLRQHLSSEC